MAQAVHSRRVRSDVTVSGLLGTLMHVWWHGAASHIVERCCLKPCITSARLQGWPTAGLLDPAADLMGSRPPSCWNYGELTGLCKYVVLAWPSNLLTPPDGTKADAMCTPTGQPGLGVLAPALRLELKAGAQAQVSIYHQAGVPGHIANISALGPFGERAYGGWIHKRAAGTIPGRASPPLAKMNHASCYGFPGACRHVLAH